MSQKHRKFTIQSMYTRSRWRRKIYPSLNISGKWMQDCGFSPQDKVRITVCKELLIIELDND